MFNFEKKLQKQKQKNRNKSGYSYQKMKKSPDERHIKEHMENWDASTLMEVFVNQKRVNVCEHSKDGTIWVSS